MKYRLTALLGLLLTAAGCKKETIYMNGTTSLSATGVSRQAQILYAPYTSGTHTGNLVITDTAGNVLWQQLGLPGLAFNFQKWEVNGTTRYTYLQEDPAGFQIPGYTSTVTGYQVVMDTGFNIIDKVYFIPNGNNNDAAQILIDGHDFVYLGDNHYIVMAYYYKHVTNIPAALSPSSTGVFVVAPVIEEIKNGVVVWSWDATDYDELYACAEEGNDYSNAGSVQDYLHINSMFIDPKDNNLICSFRNANLILKLNRKTGDIVWRLGGPNSDFKLSEDQQFLRQHHATLTDNGQTLLLLDNGFAATRAYSRILEFQLDEAGKTIKSFKYFNVPDKFIQYMGSVQKFDGSYFISGGFSNYILQANATNSAITFKLPLSQATYRAFKYE